MRNNLSSRRGAPFLSLLLPLEDNWIEMVVGFVAIPVVGDEWVVSPEQEATAEEIQGAIGGSCGPHRADALVPRGL